MTIDEVINELTQIMEEFGKDLLVNCYDLENYYQPLKNVVSYIESFTPEPELEKYKETLKNIVDKENKE